MASKVFIDGVWRGDQAEKDMRGFSGIAKSALSGVTSGLVAAAAGMLSFGAAIRAVSRGVELNKLDEEFAGIAGRLGESPGGLLAQLRSIAGEGPRDVELISMAFRVMSREIRDGSVSLEGFMQLYDRYLIMEGVAARRREESTLEQWADTIADQAEAAYKTWAFNAEVIARMTKDLFNYGLSWKDYVNPNVAMYERYMAAVNDEYDRFNKNALLAAENSIDLAALLPRDLEMGPTLADMLGGKENVGAYWREIEDRAKDAADAIREAERAAREAYERGIDRTNARFLRGARGDMGIITEDTGYFSDQMRQFNEYLEESQDKLLEQQAIIAEFGTLIPENMVQPLRDFGSIIQSRLYPLIRGLKFSLLDLVKAVGESILDYLARMVAYKIAGGIIGLVAGAITGGAGAAVPAIISGVGGFGGGETFAGGGPRGKSTMGGGVSTTGVLQANTIVLKSSGWGNSWLEQLAPYNARLAARGY